MGHSYCKEKSEVRFVWVIAVVGVGGWLWQVVAGRWRLGWLVVLGLAGGGRFGGGEALVAVAAGGRELKGGFLAFSL